MIDVIVWCEFVFRQTSAFTAPIFTSQIVPFIWLAELILRSSLPLFAMTTLGALNKNSTSLPTLRSRFFSLSTVIIAHSGSPPASLAMICEFTAPVWMSVISTFSWFLVESFMPIFSRLKRLSSVISSSFKISPKNASPAWLIASYARISLCA